MIVKNESQVIARCLASCKDLIDYWVIVDTGSTDDTQEIIRKELKGIPGELHSRPWVNFGHNRQEALLLAKKKGDYILFMDADDKLEFSEGFQLPDLIEDYYFTAGYTAQGAEYIVIQLIKADLDWCWEGVVHEELLCKKPVQGSYLQKIRYRYIHDGARGKDPKTEEKDRALLEEDVKKHPENARSIFHLARLYANSNHPEEALKWYKKRAEMTKNDVETYCAQLMVGILQDQLHFDTRVIEESFFKAYLVRPDRAESLYYLACKLCQRNEFEKSYEMLNLALQLPSDVVGQAYERWIYDYGLLYQFMVSAAKTEQYSKAIELCQQLMKNPNLPETVRVEVAKHLEWVRNKNSVHIEKRLRELVDGF